MRAAVDRGGRTAPVVADLIGTTPGIARRLVGRDRMPACCHLPGDDMAALSPHRIPLGHLLDALGPGALPLTADRAGWTGFLACCMTLEAVLERGRVADPAPAVCAGLLLGGGADWNARRDSQLQPGRPSPTGAGDMVAAFAGFLSAAAGRRIPANAALALLAGRWSLARLLAASLAFHADPRLSSGLGEIPDRVTWPVPFAPYAVRGGWSVTVLSNPRQLRDEGAHGPDADGVDGLGHCVGGYARACWSGESLVLSVRRSADGRTRRVSTAELRPDPDGTWRLGTRVYALHQHSARGNATPPPEAVGVLARLRAALAMGEVPVDEAALTPRIGEPEMGSPRERAEALHGAWRAVMPRALARLDLDVLVALAVPEDPGLAA